MKNNLTIFLHVDKTLWPTEFKVSFTNKHPWLIFYFLASLKHAFHFLGQEHYFEKSGVDIVFFSVTDTFLLDFQRFGFLPFVLSKLGFLLWVHFLNLFYLFCVLFWILNHLKIFLFLLLLIYVLYFLKEKLFLSQYFTIKCFNECFINECLCLGVTLCCQDFHSRTSNISVLREYKTNYLMEILWDLNYTVDINVEETWKIWQKHFITWINMYFWDNMLHTMQL